MKNSQPLNQPDPNEWRQWTDFSSSVFQKNVEQLCLYHPLLYKSLQEFLSSPNYFLRTGNHDVIECAIRHPDRMEVVLSSDRLQTEWPAIHASLQSFSPLSHSTVILHCGFDLGNTLPLILRYLQQAPQKAILFIEPEFTWFALTLAAHSMESFLQSNRCFFAIGNDWFSQVHSLFLENSFFVIDRPDLFLSGTARLAQRQEVFLPLKTKIIEWIHQGRRQYEQEIEKTIQFYAQKPFIPIRRILALHLQERDGKAIPSIQQRFLSECQRWGIEISYHRPGFRSDVGFLQTIARQKPDLIFLINKSPGEYTDRKILDRIRIPRMIWCLDDPHCFVRETFGQHDFVFTWDPAYQNCLRSMNATSVDHFPYVADMDEIEPHVQERFRSPVSFVGQVKLYNPNEWGHDSKTSTFIRAMGQCKAQEPHLDYSQLILEKQQQYGIQILQNINDPIPASIRYGIYIVANAQRRISILEKAMPFGLKIYGNDDWSIVLENHPLRDCFAGPADPQKEVPDLFVSTTINLNIHSLHALSSLNQRDFNCPLVGGFLLTDWVEGADTYFTPNEEMAFYHSPNDLQDKIEYYLHHEEERQAIVQRGRMRVKKEHTYTTRVPRILEILQTRIRERYE